jgi:LysR family transcriptional regulator, low CO2-responsive transcriptional regulator
MHNFTLRQLETIREVGKCGTMVKAAKVLCVTPAALTSRVKLLEEDLGLELFERFEGRLRLTDAGKEVVAAAARIDNVMADLLETLHGKSGQLSGRIRISTVTTAKYFVPRLIAAFMRQHPRVDLRLSIGNRSEVASSLRDYEADIALMGRPPEDFAVESQPIGPHPNVMIARPDHPLAGKAHISKRELVGQNFIVREQGSGTRSMFDYFFSGLSMRSDKVRIEIASNETIKQAVMAGLGLSLISAHTIEAEVASGRLAILDVDGLPIIREWYAIHRSDRVLSQAGRAMWNFMVTAGHEFLPKAQTGLGERAKPPSPQKSP